MLHAFITTHRDQIITRCRERVATRPHSQQTDGEIDYGVPQFLDQLVNTLRSPGQPTLEIGTSAALHGHALLLKGFTVSQVVHDYGDVCQVITELALEAKAPIETGDFRTLNRCLDEAIAGAVTVYGRESEQSSLDGQTERGNQQMGFFTHELRNLVNTAIMAFAGTEDGQRWRWREHRTCAGAEPDEPPGFDCPVTRRSPSDSGDPKQRADFRGRFHRHTRGCRNVRSLCARQDPHRVAGRHRANHRGRSKSPCRPS